MRPIRHSDQTELNAGLNSGSSAKRYMLAALGVIVTATMLAVRLGSAPPPPPRTYIGQESCMSSGCHANAYSDVSSYKGADAFRQTMHQKIHLRPNPQTVILDRFFENDTILRAYDPQILVPGKDTLLVEFSKSADKRDYYLQFRFSGGGDSTPKMKVAYTYGGNGWIQRYLVEVNGAYFVAPFQYILPAYKNRNAYGGRIYYLDLTRWFAIDGTSSEGKFYDINSNQFRSQSWDNNCASCHVNGFDVKTVVNGSDTAWHAQWVGTGGTDSALHDQNIKVGCESCHGPGSEHAANPRTDNIISPNAFPHDSVGVQMRWDLCGQCHARIRSSKSIYPYSYNDSLGIPYQPGDRLRDFIEHPYLAMSVWGDGTTSSAHHQQSQDMTRSGHFAKNIFQNGCWSCHQVHTNNEAGLPFQLDRNWYSLDKGEGCANIACHPSMVDTGFSPIVGRTVNLHTMHSQSISQCVNCHFTDVASISFDTVPGRSLYDFSDHSFRVLRPNLTRLYATRGVVGMINTCAASCHRNGRGSRNISPPTPEAPDYGVTDASLIYWKEPSDFELADSLWFHYKIMYAKYLSGVRHADAATLGIAITQAAPNPFRGRTTLTFSVPRHAAIELAIYDLQGRFLRTLAAGEHDAGTYTAMWDGTDDVGGEAAAGIYVARLTAQGRSATMKLILQR